MDTTNTSVLIAGAGLGGLTTALFLAERGVRAMVVDRHPGTSQAPKARGQMPPIMEPLRAAGVADAILAGRPPGRPEMTIQICAAVTGYVMHSFTEQFPDFSAFSPTPVGMASQATAEAALAERAAELGADLRFRTRMEGFTDDGDAVRATLRDLATGEEYEVRAEYLVAATGHRGGAAEAAGIGAHGVGAFEEMQTVLFEADMSAHVPDTAVLMYYVQNEALPGGSGVFVSTDEPGRYVAGMQSAEGRTDEETIALIRVITGVPDLEVKLLGADTWSIAHRVADRFSAGRVFLVGDAAHVMPPTGGQGGNTAMMDGYHLAWKLAAVVKGQAGPGLLDSHDTEWRPYGQLIADWQVSNMIDRQAPHLEHLRPELPETDEGKLMFGYRLREGAFAAEPDADGTMFEDPSAPTGRPGTRAPHIWLENAGTRISTRDLLTGDFVLLTGAPEAASAAREVAERLGVPIDAYVLGRDLHDPEGRWTTAYGVPDAGTVLIRPDGFIAWRTTTPLTPDALESALRTILDR